jgi:hypothetical protein
MCYCVGYDIAMDMILAILRDMASQLVGSRFEVRDLQFEVWISRL